LWLFKYVWYLCVTEQRSKWCHLHVGLHWAGWSLGQSQSDSCRWCICWTSTCTGLKHFRTLGARAHTWLFLDCSAVLVGCRKGFGAEFFRPIHCLNAREFAGVIYKGKRVYMNWIAFSLLIANTNEWTGVTGMSLSSQLWSTS